MSLNGIFYKVKFNCIAFYIFSVVERVDYIKTFKGMMIAVHKIMISIKLNGKG